MDKKWANAAKNEGILMTQSPITGATVIDNTQINNKTTMFNTYGAKMAMATLINGFAKSNTNNLFDE